MNLEEQVAKVLGKEDGGFFTADPNRYEDGKNPVLNRIWQAIENGLDDAGGWLKLAASDSHYARIAEALDLALEHTDSFFMEDISMHAVPFILSRICTDGAVNGTLESLSNCIAVEAFIFASVNANSPKMRQNGKGIIIPSKEWRLNIAAQMVLHTIDILNISLDDENAFTGEFRWIKAAADKILNGDDAAIKA